MEETKNIANFLLKVQIVILSDTLDTSNVASQ
mgnify:CR=1 FL=1